MPGVVLVCLHPLVPRAWLTLSTTAEPDSLEIQWCGLDIAQPDSKSQRLECARV